MNNNAHKILAVNEKNLLEIVAKVTETVQNLYTLDEFTLAIALIKAMDVDHPGLEEAVMPALKARATTQAANKNSMIQPLIVAGILPAGFGATV